MSNLNKVARTLAYTTTLGPGVCRDLAGILDNAGLLAPDLPEPQEHGGEIIWPVQDPDEWTVSLHDGWVRLSDERGAIFTANKKLARDLGHIFLAAANETEKRG